MPKQLLEIRDFKGIDYRIDSSDATPNTASFAENVDFYSEYGVLEGRIADEILDVGGNGDDQSTRFINIIRSEQNVADIVYIDGTDSKLMVLPSVHLDAGSDNIETSDKVEIGSSYSVYADNTSVVKNQSIHFGQANYATPAEAKWVGYLSYGQWWITPSGQSAGDVPTKTPSNYYAGHDECKPYNNEFTMTTPAHDSEESQGIISGYKYFYKYSLTYDGYQESPLVAPDTGTNSFVATNTNQIEFNLSIGTEANLSKRVSHVNIYRAYSPSGSLNSVEETPYRFMKQIALDTEWSSGGTGVAKFIDIGRTTSSYEAITGINEVVGNTSIKYGVSTTGNDFHFVGAGTQADIGDAKNYIFKSKAFKYSIFDWSVDFLILPETPTALSFWNGRLYAFGKNSVYKIEPNNFYIEDTFVGAGASHQKAVLVTEQGMFHFDNNHVYMNNGNFSKIISQPVEFPNLNTALGDVSGKMGYGSFNQILGYDTSGGTDNIIAYNPINNSIMVTFNKPNISKALVYSIDQNTWHLWKTPYVDTDINCTVYSYFIAVGTCFLATSVGIYAISPTVSISQDNQIATRTSFEWVSNKIMFGNNSQQKSLIKIDSDKSANVTISAIPINSYAVTEYDADDDDYENITTLSLPAKMYSTQLKITGTGAGRLSTVSLNYRTLRGTPT